MVVLLVDEAAGVRLRLRELIVQRVSSAVVREGRNAAEACAIAATDPVEIIIVDVHLQDASGLATLAHLRAGAPRALIVVLTNEANPIHHRECLRRGADHFLDKARDFGRAVDLVAEHGAAGPSQRMTSAS